MKNSTGFINEVRAKNENLIAYLYKRSTENAAYRFKQRKNQPPQSEKVETIER